MLNGNERFDFTDFLIETMKFDGDKKEDVNEFLSFLYFILRNSYLERDFEKYEIIQELDRIQREVFPDFLLNAKRIGILDFSYVDEIGRYKFVNNLFPLYCIIKFIESGGIR